MLDQLMSQMLAHCPSAIPAAGLGLPRVPLPLGSPTPSRCFVCTRGSLAPSCTPCFAQPQRAPAPQSSAGHASHPWSGRATFVF